MVGATEAMPALGLALAGPGGRIRGQRRSGWRTAPSRGNLVPAVPEQDDRTARLSRVRAVKGHRRGRSAGADDRPWLGLLAVGTGILACAVVAVAAAGEPSAGGERRDRPAVHQPVAARHPGRRAGRAGGAGPGRRPGRAGRPADAARGRLWLTVLGLIVLVAVLSRWQPSRTRSARRTPYARGRPTAGTVRVASDGSGRPGSSSAPAGALAVGAVLLRRHAARLGGPALRRHRPRRRPDAAAALRTVEASLIDLADPADPRQAVIAAYAAPARRVAGRRRRPGTLGGSVRARHARPWRPRRPARAPPRADGALCRGPLLGPPHHGGPAAGCAARARRRPGGPPGRDGLMRSTRWALLGGRRGDAGGRGRVAGGRRASRARSPSSPSVRRSSAISPWPCAAAFPSEINAPFAPPPRRSPPPWRPSGPDRAAAGPAADGGDRRRAEPLGCPPGCARTCHAAAQERLRPLRPRPRSAGRPRRGPCRCWAPRSTTSSSATRRRHPSTISWPRSARREPGPPRRRGSA